ncbi:uncharacterized protein LOC129842311 [Salvelinus fontinalis]|uniref:uncharacterized protein LOC129842311 n=1 Tax=Salvelinus fontinalis TaxID=8038 RepID=UPI00248693D3|nr:uncharacterized protein LOC129842311 [Salvelinus fontinalis]
MLALYKINQCILLTVELQKPDIDINDESLVDITITCVLPESVRDGSSCNLYTGDQPQAYKEAQAIRMRWKSSLRILCTFSVSKKNLFSRLQERRDVSCDYRENTGFFSLSPHSDLYNFTAGLTVSSTLTPNPPVRPTTNRTTKCLTFPLTPSTHTSSETSVQLWQAAVGVVSGVVMFLMGFTAVYLCRRTKKNNSQRPTARQDDHSQCDLLMVAVSSAAMLDSRDAGIYSLITNVPSTFLPSGPVEENGQSPEKDNSDTYHVYSSIPDRPATSAQPDGLYSLLQTH